MPLSTPAGGTKASGLTPDGATIEVVFGLGIYTVLLLRQEPGQPLECLRGRIIFRHYNIGEAMGFAQQFVH